MFQFSWKNCGNSSFPSEIDDISLSPDPMKLPGSVNIGFGGQLKINVDSPIMVCDIDCITVGLFVICITQLIIHFYCGYNSQILPSKKATFCILFS